jgi:hypothetical protein
MISFLDFHFIIVREALSCWNYQGIARNKTIMSIETTMEGWVALNTYGSTEE